MRPTTMRFGPLAAVMALALAACGDDDAATTADANLAVPPVTPDLVVVYPIGTEASLEAGAMRAEVDRLRGTGNQTMPAQGQPDTSGNMVGGNMTGGNQSGTAAGDPPSGGAPESFGALDRDGDSRLSPAEYAIYALPSETPARQGATNDENPPYVSDEALNSVVTSFRRLDTNGDFFLSEEEFPAASR